MQRNVLYNSIYILRVWCDGDDSSSSPWRFTVENTATGERRGFTEMVDVAGFIQTAAEAGLMKKNDPVRR